MENDTFLRPDMAVHLGGVGMGLNAFAYRSKTRNNNHPPCSHSVFFCLPHHPFCSPTPSPLQNTQYFFPFFRERGLGLNPLYSLTIKRKMSDASSDDWETWTCGACTMENSPNDTRCTTCQTHKSARDDICETLAAQQRQYEALARRHRELAGNVTSSSSSSSSSVPVPVHRDPSADLARSLQQENQAAEAAAAAEDARSAELARSMALEEEQFVAADDSSEELARRLQKEWDDAAAAEASRQAIADEEIARLLEMDAKAAEEEKQRQLDIDMAMAVAEQEEDRRREEVRKRRDEAAAIFIRDMLKLEEEAIEGDVALARSMQEEEGVCTARCRFCASICALPNHISDCAAFCTKDECQANGRVHCMHKHPCGHPCCGVRGETRHVTKCGDAACNPGGVPNCTICLDSINEAGLPCVQLDCSHVFHQACLWGQLDSAINDIVPGKKLHFALIRCPECTVLMKGDPVEKKMEPLTEVVNAALVEARRVVGREEVKDLQELLASDPEEFDRQALKTFAFFKCRKEHCLKVFCGGRQACGEAGDEDPNYDQAICPQCEYGGSAAVRQACTRGHDVEDLMKKCDFCCDVATYVCNLGSRVHFCNACHSHPYQKRAIKPCVPENCRLAKIGAEYVQFLYFFLHW